MRLMTILKNMLKKSAFRYTTFGIPQYPYLVEPIQLATLVFEIDRLRNISGAIAEIGVARGMTTRFVCEHLVKGGYTNQELYAIDTFASFRDSDIDHEVVHRGKRKGDLQGHFGYNDFEVWKGHFNRFPFVKAIQADCATFDYASIAPIKLVFLDVDLYLPTRRALPRIYEHICDGGIILVDDVLNDSSYDGAFQAYTEFCDELKINPNIIGNKCGVIRKDMRY